MMMIQTTTWARNSEISFLKITQRMTAMIMPTIGRRILQGISGSPPPPRLCEAGRLGGVFGGGEYGVGWRDEGGGVGAPPYGRELCPGLF